MRDDKRSRFSDLRRPLLLKPSSLQRLHPPHLTSTRLLKPTTKPSGKVKKRSGFVDKTMDVGMPTSAYRRGTTIPRILVVSAINHMGTEWQNQMTKADPDR